MMKALERLGVSDANDLIEAGATPMLALANAVPAREDAEVVVAWLI